jgi:hypothetical protein
MEIAERLINGYVSILWFITQFLWLFQTIKFNVQQFELHMPMLLTLAAKRRRRFTAIVWRFLSVRPSVRLSVRHNLPELTGKGR